MGETILIKVFLPIFLALISSATSIIVFLLKNKTSKVDKIVTELKKDVKELKAKDVIESNNQAFIKIIDEIIAEGIEGMQDEKLISYIKQRSERIRNVVHNTIYSNSNLEGVDNERVDEIFDNLTDENNLKCKEILGKDMAEHLLDILSVDMYKLRNDIKFIVSDKQFNSKVRRIYIEVESYVRKSIQTIHREYLLMKKGKNN